MHEVLQKFFSPHSFRVALPDVWQGFQLNLKLMIVAEILVLILALGIAVVRGLPGRGAAPFRALAIVYTDVFRGTPLILVAFLVGFGLPGLNIPCGLSEGLPVGLQLIGPQFGENMLFRVGHALEQALGFDFVPERLR